MDMLKKYFPFSFGSTDVTNLVIRIIVYAVVGILMGAVIGILSNIPILGWIFGIICGLIDLYVLVGIVLLVLDYLKVLK